MTAEMRNVRDDGETNEERGKDGEELVKGHSAALTEDVVPPGFPEGPAQQFGKGETSERPEAGYTIPHEFSLRTGPRPSRTSAQN